MTPYRILRLRSGEDVIARIKGKKNGNLLIERPMQMKITTLVDADGVTQKDMLLLRNWLQYTTHIEAEIPMEWVAIMLTPDKIATSAYDRAKEDEDCNPPVSEELFPPKQQQQAKEPTPNNFSRSVNNEVEPGSIFVTLAIPPMLFVHLLSQGLLNGGMMEDEDEQGPGNNLGDWSPNIEDYFDDEE